MEATRTFSEGRVEKEPIAQVLEPVGHRMSLSDPENPMNWPLSKKIYASAVGWAFSFVVAFGATAYTAGISEVVLEFNVSMTVAVLGLSLNLLGIMFAPIITPHLSERFGRSPVYFVSIPLFALFTVGAGASKSFASLAACRFFAGFFGGPCLVLIEGTFADVWSAEATGVYYSALAVSSYVGTGCGPLICGFVVAAASWRWTQWVTVMLALAAFLLGIGVPETYPREILRRRARRSGNAGPKLAKAESGETLGEMIKITLFTPLQMMFTEPLVAIATLYVAFNFGVLFSFFISVPVVLNLTYGFDVQQAGIAFTAALAGSLLSALTSVIIDRLTYPRQLAKNNNNLLDVVEYRLLPAMFGAFGLVISLFWIGWTASPTINWPSPVLGTMLYVWGSQSIIIGIVSYLFEAYPPAGTLSALTAAASTRLAFAAIIPLVIIQMIKGLTGAWALSTFGFIAAAFAPLPWILFKWGPTFRARSKHGHMRTGIHVIAQQSTV